MDVGFPFEGFLQSEGDHRFKYKYIVKLDENLSSHMFSSLLGDTK